MKRGDYTWLDPISLAIVGLILVMVGEEAKRRLNERAKTAKTETANNGPVGGRNVEGAETSNARGEGSREEGAGQRVSAEKAVKEQHEAMRGLKEARESKADEPQTGLARP